MRTPPTRWTTSSPWRWLWGAAAVLRVVQPRARRDAGVVSARKKVRVPGAAAGRRRIETKGDPPPGGQQLGIAYDAGPFGSRPREANNGILRDRVVREQHHTPGRSFFGEPHVTPRPILSVRPAQQQETSEGEGARGRGRPQQAAPGRRHAGVSQLVPQKRQAHDSQKLLGGGLPVATDGASVEVNPPLPAPGWFPIAEAVALQFVEAQTAGRGCLPSGRSGRPAQQMGKQAHHAASRTQIRLEPDGLEQKTGGFEIEVSRQAVRAEQRGTEMAEPVPGRAELFPYGHNPARPQPSRR